MADSNKINLLKKHFGNPNRSGDEYIFQCPKCRHPKKKLSVNFIKDVFKCWVCGYSGTSIQKLVHHYISESIDWSGPKTELALLRYNSLLQSEKLPEKITCFPNSFIPLTSKENTPLKTRALEFLMRRGILYKDMIKWRMGYSEEEELYGRIIVPSYDTDGDCVFYSARSFIESKYKYWTPNISKSGIIFNEIDIDWEKPVIFEIVTGKHAISISII